MARQLLEAARLGDVKALESLLRDDPLTLERVALLPFAETPLHIASLARKTDFVRKIISLKPSFAWDLNQDGVSALHIASALGDIEIVRLLLTLSPDLCLLKDNNGRTSLHHAAIRGRTAVIEELLSKCPQALNELTAVRDTALHLAVKNQQYEALRTLVERLGDNRDVMNAKNEDGLCVFLLAKATCQLHVLDLLGGRDKRLEMAHAAAAANENKLQPGISRRGRRPPQKSLFQMFKLTFDDQSMLVVAVLIAAVTFQSFLTPPANLWKENTKLDYMCIFQNFRDISHPRRYHQCHKIIFFLIFNTTGFFSSLSVLILFKSGTAAQILMAESLFSLFGCYLSLMGALLPDSPSNYIFAFSLLMAPLLPVLCLMLKKNIQIRNGNPRT